jgi:hypothetical protein
MSFDRDKFKELVHYVVWKAASRDKLGSVKLNKILWFSDTGIYKLTGKPLTGATYIREKFGPVPREIMPVRAELVSEGRIIVSRGKFYNYDKYAFEAVTAPATTAFTKPERQTIDFWVKHIRDDHTAQSISDKSHDYTWEIAQMGEVIPYYAVFATRVRESRGKELEWARAEAKRLGLA